MGPHIAGGVGMNDVFPRRDLALIPGLGDDLRDVVPDSLRQAVVWTAMTSGSKREIFVNGLGAGCLPAEHGGAFVKAESPRSPAP